MLLSAPALPGRQQDIANIEQVLFAGANRILLLCGEPGAGKSALLQCLKDRWKPCNRAGDAFYFSYREKAWTSQDILECAGGELLAGAVFLDHLECSTRDEPFSRRNPLSTREKKELNAFLQQLAGTETRVVLAARKFPEWLELHLLGSVQYELKALDREAAASLARSILHEHAAAYYLGESAFEELLDLLAGNPLALTTVLPALERHAPENLLQKFRASLKGRDLTPSDIPIGLPSWVSFAHGNFDRELELFLLCLAPFRGVLFESVAAEFYTAKLQQQEPFAQLPYKNWPLWLEEATSVGLLHHHPEHPAFLQIAPELACLISLRMNQPKNLRLKQAARRAFMDFYLEQAHVLIHLVTSRNAADYELGQSLTHLQYQNLHFAHRLLLEAKIPDITLFRLLDAYLSNERNPSARLAVGESVLSSLSGYPSERMPPGFAVHLAKISQHIAAQQFIAGKLGEAQSNCQYAMKLLVGDKEVESCQIRAEIYYRLGRCAQQKQEWQAAENYYQRSMKAHPPSQQAEQRRSQVHYRLGQILTEQKKLEMAEEHFLKALEIKTQINSLPGQAELLLSLSFVTTQRGKASQAEKLCKQALQLAKQAVDQRLELQCYEQLGKVSMAQSQFLKAAKYFQNALEVLDTTDEFPNRLNTLTSISKQLAALENAQRRYLRAETFWRRTLKAYKTAGDPFGEQECLSQLRELAQLQWSPVGVDDASQDDVLENVEVESRNQRAELNLQCAFLAMEAGKPSLAMERTFAALRLLTHPGEESNRHLALRSLALFSAETPRETLLKTAAELSGLTPQGVLRFMNTEFGAHGSVQ